jgi:hypothetical protein
MVSIHLEAKYSNVGQKNDEFGFALHFRRPKFGERNRNVLYQRRFIEYVMFVGYIGDKTGGPDG